MDTMNTIWLLLCAALVFFMQAGFTCYETGMVQSKNVISVAIENMLNLTLTIVLFSLVGYPIMYGHSLFEIQDYGFFFLQVMFAATSVTIFAGALSERTRLVSLLVAGALSAAAIYPVFGHLAWGSKFTGEASWLEKLGYMDFAGASVVHMTAGFIALAGLLMVGSRRKKRSGKSNIPLAVLGVFILWFGWFGFNGSCTTPDSPELGKIFLNTTLAAACGTLGALAINLIMKLKGGYLISLFNGVLAGLAAITALSAYCSPIKAMLVGSVAGVMAECVAHLLKHFGLDDVVNVVATHLAGGLTGTLMLAVCADKAYLMAGSRLLQFGVQLTGALVDFLWSFGTALVMFFVLKRTLGLRVTEEEEEKGLNIVEFGDLYSWQNYMETSSYENRIREKNDLLRRQSRLLAMTEEQEKEKLAKDLHDSIGQSLSALKVILHINKTQAEKSHNEKLVENAQKAAELADTSLKEMRNVLNNLRPEALNSGGLKAGLEALTENLNKIDGLTCILKLDGELPSFDETVELNLYRLIQEALTNVVKHANATRVEVVCGPGSEKGRFCIEVKDNGEGFEPKKTGSGVGIGSMQDRLQMLGGTFSLCSEIGKGTQVRMEVPIDE